MTGNSISVRISHEVRNLTDEIFYSEAAASLMKLLAQTRQNPDLKNVREISIGEKGVLLYLVSRPEGVPSGELSKALGIGFYELFGVDASAAEFRRVWKIC